MNFLKKIFYQIYDKGYEQGYKDAENETLLTTGGHLYLANDNGELIDIGLCGYIESEDK